MGFLMLLGASQAAMATTNDLTSPTTAFLALLANTRSGNAAVRNSSGQWTLAGANVVRRDYDSAGNPLGILQENTTTNKTTQRNFAPTGTTGITVISGDGSASLVSSDSKIAAATIDISTYTALQNGNSVQLTGGTAGTVYQISETTGNTNPHSWRVCIATSATGANGSVGLSDGAANLSISPGSTAYVEYVKENVTPGSSSNYLAVNVSAGKTLTINATQVEENWVITSPIVTAGATAARTRDSYKIANPAALGLKGSAGCIIMNALMYQPAQAAQGYFGYSNGNGTTDLIAMHTVATRGMADGQYFVSSSDKSTNDVQKMPLDKAAPVGIRWRFSTVVPVAGKGMRNNSIASPGLPATPDALYLGSTRQFGDFAIKLHIKSLTTFNDYPTLKQMGAVMGLPSDSGLVLLGQSQNRSKCRSQITFGNDGEVALVVSMGDYWSSGENYVIDASINGSGLIKANHSTLYWWDDTLDIPGPLTLNAVEQLNSCPATVVATSWNQGETDVNALTAAEWEGWLIKVFTYLRANTGITNIGLEPPGRRSDSAASDVGYSKWRALWRLLPTKYAYLYLLPETCNLALEDEAGIIDPGHIKGSEWAVQAPRIVRKAAAIAGKTVTGGVDGPTWTASLSGNNVLVDLTHDSGTDFTPTTAIQGFMVKVSGSAATITGVTRTSATRITIASSTTLTPGLVTVEYLPGVLYGTDPTKLVMDNAAVSMPLRSNIFTL